MRTISSPIDIHKFSKKLTLIAFFGLMITLLFHIIFKNFYPSIPRALLIIFFILPMLFPLRGLLKGNRKTFIWSSYLSLFYLPLSIDTFISYDKAFAIAVFILSTSWFIGCFLSIKINPKS